VATSRPSGRLSARKSFAVRLVAAMLAMSLPIVLLLAALLTTQASHSLTSAAEGKDQSVARAVTSRLEDWLTERHEDLDFSVPRHPARHRPARYRHARAQRPRSARSLEVRPGTEGHPGRVPNRQDGHRRHRRRLN
jgi:hypothetical protein